MILQNSNFPRAFGQMHNNLEDSFSIFPDDILVSVLSNLKLIEAARTSVLSHRWRNLWKHTHGSLDFDKYELVDHFIDFEEYQKSDQVLRSRFIAWVNRVLDLHQGCKLNEFIIRFNLDDTSTDVINRWILFALKKKVKRLVLDFERKICIPCKNYCLTTQHLGNHHFESLTDLHLNHVDVTENTIQYIMLRCQFLQVLHVKNSSSLVDLRIPGPLPNLKRVEILYCESLKYIEVNAINVASFTYHGRQISVVFKDVPHLVEATYGGLYGIFWVANIRQFSSYTLHLESLVLGLTAWPSCLEPVCGAFPRSFPDFPKLRLLELRFCGLTVFWYLHRCTLLLKAMPALQKFKLQIGLVTDGKEHNIREVKKPAPSTYQHRGLKVMEFIIFEWNVGVIGIVLDLLSQCPCLEKAILQPSVESWASSVEKEDAISNCKSLENCMSPEALVTALLGHCSTHSQYLENRPGPAGNR